MMTLPPNNELLGSTQVIKQGEAARSALPLVSVIIPYHNEGETFLHRALASVHAQTYTGEIEIVVVDDASDHSPDVPPGGRCRVRLIRSERNLLASGARNLGMRHSSGELVAFLDADDEYLPGKIRDEATALLRWDEAVLVGGQGYIHRGGKTWLHEPLLVGDYFGKFQATSPCLLPDRIRLDVCTKYLFHTCGFVVRRKALEAAGGFSDAYRWWGEEWDLQIRLAQAGRIGYVPSPGYRYIQRAGSTTQVQNPLKFECMAELYRTHRLGVAGLTRAHRRQMRAAENEALLLAAQLYLEERDRPVEAWGCAWKAVRRKFSVWGFRSLVRTTLHTLGRTLAPPRRAVLEPVAVPVKRTEA
jgi:glycosyltransferase involved in cell wall biosynthesis